MRAVMRATMKTPVYFLSHGGPNIMYDTEHPAHKKLQEIGREITGSVRPEGIVVFSAHWQGGRDVVEVNTKEYTDLVYDFRGFPSHYYKETFPNRGSPALAKSVIGMLREAGIGTREAERGLDHGVWSSFKCIFDPATNPINVPIVQVSLFDTEDPGQHYRLGRAVGRLREQNILIVVSGMAVHNLIDFRATRGDLTLMPYTTSFDEALKEAVEAEPKVRERTMADLLQRADARKAHPTFEHLLPIHIGAGAARDDTGHRLWTMTEGSVSWAQYRFGEVAAAT